MTLPASGPGRLLERIGDDAPRGMTVHDRTRLIGRLRRSTCPCDAWTSPQDLHAQIPGPRATPPHPHPRPRRGSPPDSGGLEGIDSPGVSPVRSTRVPRHRIPYARTDLSRLVHATHGRSPGFACANPGPQSHASTPPAAPAARVAPDSGGFEGIDSPGVSPVRSSRVPRRRIPDARMKLVRCARCSARDLCRDSRTLGVRC